MKREELVRELARRLTLPEHSAQVFLHAFFDTAKAALRTGDTLRIDGLGAWTPVLHDDGTLRSIEYISAALDTGTAPAQGPASSIDAMHFIPVNALENMPLRRHGIIDVADVVREVQRLFVPAGNNGTQTAAPEQAAPESVTETGTSDADAEGETAPAPAVTPEPAPLLDDSDDEAPRAEEIPVEVRSATGAESDTEEMADAATAAVHPDEAASGNDTPMDVQQPPREAARAEMPDEAGWPDEAEKSEADEDEDEEDNEVFYRNRDQLYHPPQERNTRPLLIVALVLTAVMLVIVLSIIFGEDERPAMPGTGDAGVPAQTVIGRMRPA